MSPDDQEVPQSNLLTLVLYPDKRLTTPCKRVPEEAFGTEELIKQAGLMVATMYGYQGIGLAANQVGYDNRVIVVAKQPESFPNTTPLVLINPAIQERSSKKQVLREGCLSFPRKLTMRKRSRSVRITAYDVQGEKFSWQAKGLAAQCLQHELEHLNGKHMFSK